MDAKKNNDFLLESESEFLKNYNIIYYIYIYVYVCSGGIYYITLKIIV